VKQKRKENGDVSIDCKSDAITLLRSSRCGEASKRRYSIRPGPIAINDVAPPPPLLLPPGRATDERERSWVGDKVRGDGSRGPAGGPPRAAAAPGAAIATARPPLPPPRAASQPLSPVDDAD